MSADDAATYVATEKGAVESAWNIFFIFYTEYTVLLKCLSITHLTHLRVYWVA